METSILSNLYHYPDLVQSRKHGCRPEPEGGEAVPGCDANTTSFLPSIPTDGWKAGATASTSPLSLDTDPRTRRQRCDVHTLVDQHGDPESSNRASPCSRLNTRACSSTTSSCTASDGVEMPTMACACASKEPLVDFREISAVTESLRLQPAANPLNPQLPT